MVIFHSYVSLPEGIFPVRPNHTLVQVSYSYNVTYISCIYVVYNGVYHVVNPINNPQYFNHILPFNNLENNKTTNQLIRQDHPYFRSVEMTGPMPLRATGIASRCRFGTGSAAQTGSISLPSTRCSGTKR